MRRRWVLCKVVSVRPMREASREAGALIPRDMAKVHVHMTEASYKVMRLGGLE